MYIYLQSTKKIYQISSERFILYKDEKCLLTFYRNELRVEGATIDESLTPAQYTLRVSKTELAMLELMRQLDPDSLLYPKEAANMEWAEATLQPSSW